MRHHDDIELLESLIQHPGFRFFAERVRAEWAERERVGRREVLNDDSNNERLVNKLRQITAAQEAVEWVVEWPTQELLRLRRSTDPMEPSVGRRGRL